MFFVGPFVVTEVCKGGYDEFACWIPVELVLAIAVGCVAYWMHLLKVRQDGRGRPNNTGQTTNKN